MLQDRGALQLPSFTLDSSILHYYIGPSTFYEMKCRKQYATSRLHPNTLSLFSCLVPTTVLLPTTIRSSSGFLSEIGNL